MLSTVVPARPDISLGGLGVKVVLFRQPAQGLAPSPSGPGRTRAGPPPHAEPSLRDGLQPPWTGRLRDKAGRASKQDRLVRGPAGGVLSRPRPAIDHPFSVTVVPGCRRAVEPVTYRPEMALRCAVANERFALLDSVTLVRGWRAAAAELMNRPEMALRW